jgi:aryl-alcohol dehydrogenase-like predicted oxidoreductase
MNQVAARHGKTITQVALRWVLDHPGVSSVVVGAKTPQQLDENLGAIGWSLAPDEWHSMLSHWTSVMTA